MLKNFASVFLEEPNQVGRYYKDLIPRIGRDIFSAQHEVFPYYTAAFLAFRLEWLFRNRRLDSKYKPFRFQLCMAARLILEREKKLDAKKKLSKSNCEAMDAVLMDVDASQALFEKAIAAVDETVAALGSQVGLDRRTAKMRDMRDSLRARLAAQSAPEGQPSVTT